MARSPEGKRGGKCLLTTVAVIAGMMISGCGGSGGKPEQDPSPDQTAELPPTHTGNPSLDSINRFRRRILTNHHARIFFNMCVAWPNSSSGLTVTYNPGVASLEVHGKKQQYYVFEAADPQTSSGLIEMNGPGLNDPVVFPVVMPESMIGRPPEGIRDAKLSVGPVTDKNNQLTYQDTSTGQPVLDTALVFGQPDIHNAINACEALRDHRTVPGIVG